MYMVLPPLRHPEPAEPHVPEDEGTLWRGNVRHLCVLMVSSDTPMSPRANDTSIPLCILCPHTGSDTLVPPPSMTVVESGSKAPR